MKINLIGIISLFVILTSLAFSQKEKPSNKITIDEARRVFVGKSVRIFSKVESDEKLSSWTYADKKDGTYKRRPHYSVWKGNRYESTYLPIDYRWQKAVIVAIEWKEESIPKTNALGEILDGKESSPSWIYVFVKFPDGTLASGLNSLETLFGEKNYIGVEVRLNPDFGWKTFMLVDELAQRSRIINSKISSIIGKEVFATAQSKLYLLSSTLVELIDNKTRINDFPYFRTSHYYNS
jgi:hypothetical protein